MKSERLYALTLYLLNHGKSSASELAKHFEVSVRTIQRDIDALCQAGIPICALTGTNGGYEILSDFKMNNQLASKDEYAYIATAINGLKTVTNNPMADDIYEKITASFIRIRASPERVSLRSNSALAGEQRPFATSSRARSLPRTVQSAAAVPAGSIRSVPSSRRVKRISGC